MSSTGPSFNHTRGDGFYSPCENCWREMSEPDKIKAVLGMCSDPYTDWAILRDLQSSGTDLGPFLDELRAEFQSTDW